jgi:hypothetical protein
MTTTVPSPTKILLAKILGWIVLPIPCLLRAWTAPPTYLSIKPLAVPMLRRVVDEWSWSLLNKWHGNSEDGVSGQQAVISLDGGKTYVWYASTFPSWTPQFAIAFAWSVWRNGANNLVRLTDHADIATPVS